MQRRAAELDPGSSLAAFDPDVAAERGWYRKSTRFAVEATAAEELDPVGHIEVVAHAGQPVAAVVKDLSIPEFSGNAALQREHFDLQDFPRSSTVSEDVRSQKVSDRDEPTSSCECRPSCDTDPFREAFGGLR